MHQTDGYSTRTRGLCLQTKTKGSSRCQGGEKGLITASPSGMTCQLTEIIWDCCNAKAKVQDMKLLIAFGSVKEGISKQCRFVQTHVFNCV